MTEILAKLRALDGPARLGERALLIALAVVGSAWALQLQHRLPRAIFNEQYLGLFLALGLAPVFLACRASSRAPNDRVPWYDWILAAGALAAGGYVMIFYPPRGRAAGPLGWTRHALIIVAGLLLIAPPRPGVPEFVTDLAGLGLGALLILLERIRTPAPLPRPVAVTREP